MSDSGIGTMTEGITVMVAIIMTEDMTTTEGMTGMQDMKNDADCAPLLKL